MAELRAVGNAITPKGNTMTEKVLELAVGKKLDDVGFMGEKELNTLGTELKPQRIFMITDGDPDDTPCDVKDRLKHKDISLFTLGIGEFNRDRLMCPDGEQLGQILVLNNFQELDDNLIKTIEAKMA